MTRPIHESKALAPGRELILAEACCLRPVAFPGGDRV